MPVQDVFLHAGKHFGLEGLELGVVKHPVVIRIRRRRYAQQMIEQALAGCSGERKPFRVAQLAVAIGVRIREALKRESRRSGFRVEALEVLEHHRNRWRPAHSGSHRTVAHRTMPHRAGAGSAARPPGTTAAAERPIVRGPTPPSGSRTVSIGPHRLEE